jgi:hypothetical protein
MEKDVQDGQIAIAVVHGVGVLTPESTLKACKAALSEGWPDTSFEPRCREFPG